MSDKKIKVMIANTFLEVANALKTRQYGKRPVIGFASEGNEHGQDNTEEAMKTVKIEGLKAVLIGGKGFHKKTEEILGSGEIDGTVAMYYSLPIGVSTVRKVITPGRGKPVYIATITDMSDTDHISGMVKNAIYGIIAAKANGVENPTIGIASIDGIRQTEKVLLEPAEDGYDISFAESVRVDSDIVMRGNDLSGGTPDIMVMDSLTGNLTMKVFLPYTIDGNYESLGFDYGPGMGEGYDRLTMIVSRAPGTSVVVGAMEFAINLVCHDQKKVVDEKFEKANEAGLKGIINELKPTGRKDIDAASEEMKMSPKEVVTSQIPGIEVVDPENAVKALWRAGTYAESGMECAGPTVLISDVNKDKVHKILKATGYIN